MQVVVLVGGLGTRLREVLPAGLPKPMAALVGRPFLEHVLDVAIDQGASTFLLLTGYAADSIESHFGDAYRGRPVAYSREPMPLGTGGALKNAASHLDDRFILLNGDTSVSVDYAALLSRLEEAPLAMAVTHVVECGRFGSIRVSDDDQVVVGFVEKGATGPGLINAGVYACARVITTYFPPDDVFSFEADVLEPVLPRMRPPFVTSAPTFFDIGVPADYRAADAYFAEQAPAS